jgi:pseudaminic acid cytidylyltransferase
MNIAIIPARGGSQRIKNKNIKSFLGKPIIGLTIKKILKTKLFKLIVVTSDSQKILDIGRLYGADLLIKRSKKLSDNYTTTKKVIINAIKILEKKYKLDNIFCFYPCNPFLHIRDINLSLKLIKKWKNCMFFPITQYSHPTERSLIVNKKKFLSFKVKSKKNQRTQDFIKSFYDSGQFYLAKKNIWKKKFYNCKGIEIPQYRTCDIDTINDWKRAEIMYPFIKKKFKIL